MSLAIVFKTFREVRFLLSVVIMGVILLETLFVVVIGGVAGEMEQLWTNEVLMAMFQRFARTLLGADLGVDISATGMMCIGLAHPLLFAMTWTMLLAVCTGVIVGEMERGTADVLLTLPLSRKRIYCSTSIVWAAAGISVVCAALAGVWLGERIRPMWEPIDFRAMWMMGVNFLLLYWCIGAATTCISSFCSRRSVALFWIIGWLMLSFLLNFLSQYSSFFERLSVIGLLHYYRPLPIVRDGAWPLLDMAFLLGLGIGSWMLGMWRYSRRDIPAA